MLLLKRKFSCGIQKTKSLVWLWSVSINDKRSSPLTQATALVKKTLTCNHQVIFHLLSTVQLSIRIMFYTLHKWKAIKNVNNGMTKPRLRLNAKTTGLGSSLCISGQPPGHDAALVNNLLSCPLEIWSLQLWLWTIWLSKLYTSLETILTSFDGPWHEY